MPMKVAFVGAGPRAITLIDRIGAHVSALGRRPVTLTLLDPYPAGAGRVWDTTQHRALLNNTSASDTTVFCDDSITSRAAIIPGPSLHEWCSTDATGHPDPWVRESAAGMHPWSKPPRALQGEYYRWALDEVIRRYDGHVTVEQIRGEVVGLSLAGAAALHLADGRRIGADAVILGMGFVDDEPAPGIRDLDADASAAGLRYLPPGMVDPEALARLDPGEPILIRGLGASFFDVLGLLSARDGPLPRLLVAGSPSGLPKRTQPDGPGPEVEVRGLDAGKADALMERHRGRRTLAHSEVWSLVHADILAAFERHAGGLDGTVLSDEDFRWEHIAAPSWRADENPDTVVARFFAQEGVTVAHPARSPWAAARRAVMEVRPRVLALIHAGALAEPDGIDIDRVFLRPAGRLTSGPPAERMVLLRDWLDAGRVQLTGPGMALSVEGGRFVARASVRVGTQWTARQAVEARQVFGTARSSSSPLVRGLLRDGAAAAGADPDRGLLVDPRDHRLVHDDDRRPACWVVGHLARSTQRGVNQGAIPHASDPFLQEADVVAHAVVEHLGTRSDQLPPRGGSGQPSCPSTATAG